MDHSGDDLDITLRPPTADVLVVESVRPKATVVGGLNRSLTDIYIDATVLDDVWRHVTSDITRELGGVLIGHLLRDPDPYVRISGSLSARYTTTTATSLTFTHDTWADLLERMDREYRGHLILGWYHSHPGHGVFMSHFDRFIHASFFTNPWQCALVVDPVNKRHGFFCWSDSQIAATGYYRVGNTSAPSVCVLPDSNLRVQDDDDNREQAEVNAPAPREYTLTLRHTLRVQLLTYGVGGQIKVLWNEPGSRFSGEA